jgi:hypothetical protein
MIKLITDLKVPIFAIDSEDHIYVLYVDDEADLLDLTVNCGNVRRASIS